MKIIFIFACSGMFRNVPACSGFYRRPEKIPAFSIVESISHTSVFVYYYFNTVR